MTKVEQMYNEGKCLKCGGGIMFWEYIYPSENAYDGWSHIQCEDCGYKVGRWSDKELAKDEEELRFGGE